jgi:hypothetical protein
MLTDQKQEAKLQRASYSGGLTLRFQISVAHMVRLIGKRALVGALQHERRSWRWSAALKFLTSAVLCW